MHEDETIDRVISELTSRKIAVHANSDTIALAAGGAILEELFLAGWGAKDMARELGARGVQVKAGTIQRARYMRPPADQSMAASQHVRNEKVARLLLEIGQLPAPPRRNRITQLEARVDQFRALVRSGTSLKEIVAGLNAEGDSTTINNLKYVLYGKRTSSVRSRPGDQADDQAPAGAESTPSWLQELHRMLKFDDAVLAELRADADTRANLIRKAVLTDDPGYLSAVAQAYCEEPAMRDAIYEALRSYRPSNAQEVYAALLSGPGEHASLASANLDAPALTTK
jgi:hypothetical protein